MSVQDKLDELTNRRRDIEACDKRASAMKSKLVSGKKTARDRIELLFDKGSFVELGAFVKPRNRTYNLPDQDASADGVVTGYGTVEGRLVYVYSQDVTVIGGALGEMHAKKIVGIYDLAMKVGAPVIGLIDSAGMRLQEAMDALDGYGQIFMKQTMASGVIPQMTAILGTCGGTAAMLPSLSDFVFMKKDNTALFLNSENTLDETVNGSIPMNSGQFHGSNVGIADIISDDEEQMIHEMRQLIGLLPSNNQDGVPTSPLEDDLNRVMVGLNSLEVDDLSMEELVKDVFDAGTSIVMKKNYGADVLTTIGRLGGMTVGIIANDPNVEAGRLSMNACKKITEFVHKLDAFHIPVITLVDVVGYTATLAEEMSGQAKEIAKMISAFSSATVPKVSVIVGSAVGSAYLALNSKHIGADLVYAWPTASIAMMDAKMAVRIMYAQEIEASQAASELIDEKVQEFAKTQGSVYAAAERGYVDDVIEPAATRKRLIAAMDMLFTKYMMSPDRKHRSV